MAGTSGAIYGIESHGIRLEYHWSRTDYSIVNCQSTVYWELRVRSAATINFSAPKKWSCTVNGNAYSGTYSNGMHGTGTASAPITQTVASGTTVIPHNSNGTKSFAVTASFGILITITSTGESLNTISLDGSDSLQTIPRVSTISTSNGTLGTAQTLTVTRQDSSFTHTITYSCGDVTGTIVTKSTSTSISWTPSLDLAKQNTTGVTVSVTFTITTYTGDSSLGSSTKTISCSMPSSIKPSAPTITVSDGNGYYSTYSAYVQGKSTFSISISSTGSYNSTITSYSSTANGTSYTTSSYTTAVIKSSGTLTISATVTDSRGRTATSSVTVTVLAYTSPAISALKTVRCTSDGTESSSGAYLKVIFSSKVTSLNSKNTATYTLSYKKKSATSYSNVTLTSYKNSYAVSNGTYIFSADTASSYNIKLAVKDNFSSGTRATDGSATTKILSIFKNGLGLAIGKAAELSEYLDVGWNAIFQKDVEILGNLSCKLRKLSNLYDTRPTSANIATDGSGGMSIFKATTDTTEGKPPSNAHIIHQYWDNTNGYDAQLALAATSDIKAYIRGQSSGTWSDWKTLADTDSIASTKRWTAKATIGEWSRICSYTLTDSAYANFLLTVRENQTSQATTNTYLIGLSHNYAAINQIGNSGYPHNSGLKIRVTVASPLVGYVELYESYAATTSTTTIPIYCQLTMLSPSTPFPTLYTAYTATDSTVTEKAILTSTPSGFATTGSIEVFSSSPCVDFHFGNSASDYTARIIESSSGVLKAYNSIANASDERLKKELESPFGDLLDAYLELYDKLEPTLYRYTNGDDYLNIGLIAQKVLELETELGIENSLLVRGTGGETEINGEIEIDYYAIDYTAISMLGLIKNRQMNEMCNNLASSYLELKEEYNSLSEKVSGLEKILTS